MNQEPDSRRAASGGRQGGNPSPLGGGGRQTTPAETRCANCGHPVRRITGTLAAWWVHTPGGNTVCHPQQAATSPRAEPGLVVPALDDYEATTGHLITCLAVAGGDSDPDCCRPMVPAQPGNDTKTPGADA